MRASVVFLGLLAFSPLSACASVGGDLEAVVDGRWRVVDLTYPLNGRSPYWPGGAYFPFEHWTIATLEADGVYSAAYRTPEHLGTHVDAPNHFEKGQPSLDAIPLRMLFCRGAVIDVTGSVEQDPDYTLALEDIRRDEATFGPIPPGSLVLLRTGWGRYWDDSDRYRNADGHGVLHFPGFSPDAARFLIAERGASALGIDTLSVDPGPSTAFPVHHLGNLAGRYFVENAAHLELLPPRGFYVIVAPIKIEGGSGGQARLYALIPPQ